MRAQFIRTLVELAEKDPRIILLSGDLGFTVIEPFVEKFPGRFFNIGVAEQNMIGIATGLAKEGFIPFAYSIVNFAALRPYEFIRNGPILHQLPVRIVGVGGGFEYGAAGMTHYGLEDVGVLRIQKGLSIVLPCDVAQTETALRKTWNWPRPVYYRIGKGDKNFTLGTSGAFESGRVLFIKEGRDILLLTYGSMAKETLEAGEILVRRGYQPAVAVVPGFNPSPNEDLLKILPRFKSVLTVEDHYVEGGLGSYISEMIAENGLGCRLRRCGVRFLSDGKIGSRNFMLKRNGLSPEELANSAIEEHKHF